MGSAALDGLLRFPGMELGGGADSPPKEMKGRAGEGGRERPGLEETRAAAVEQADSSSPHPKMWAT